MDVTPSDTSSRGLSRGLTSRVTYDRIVTSTLKGGYVIMSGEGDNDNVEKIVPNEEGKIPAGKDNKYPEVVPWSKYVGIKESLGNKLDAERAKVTSLEEKLNNAASTEELERVKGELKEATDKLQTTNEELNTTKEKTLTEKRSTLTKRGIPEDKVKDMSSEELTAAIVVLELSKPNPDMGGGGGSGSLEGSPLELAQRAYSSSNK